MIMSPDEPESISYDATEASKQWVYVEALGRRIVDELGLEKGVDTLARWMAHYIAELIEKVEVGVRELMFAMSEFCAISAAT